jgi:hypothetical protein
MTSVKVTEWHSLENAASVVSFLQVYGTSITVRRHGVAQGCRGGR